MNKQQEEAARRAAVMIAFSEGKPIEYLYHNGRTGVRNWRDCFTPGWDWRACDYRVKQVPREWMVLSSPAGATMYECSAWRRDAIKRYVESGWQLITVVEKLNV